MALCSQAFNKSTKRSCSSIDSNNSKRICLSNYKFPNKNVSISSSEEEENSEDEQLCYKMDQIKAKRRASSRISFSLTPNVELSKFVSKYSDDEDENIKSNHQDNENDLRRKSIINNSNNKELSSNQQQINDYDFKLIEIPRSDKLARSRCFDYLVGAIDEAWARYCDATSCIEDEVFYSDDNKENIIASNVHKNAINKNMNVNYNNDYGINNTSDVYSTINPLKAKHQSYDSNDEDFDDDTKSEIIDNYSINSTDLTDISDNYLSQQKILRNKQFNIRSRSNSSKSTNQYQKLKDRLTKAKYYLQDLVDSDDYQDLQCFWNRWDMIKYATIELVEDDDDDEVVESTIDELENGRYFVN